ncbi:MAG: ribonuclease III [Lachnospiraceae bacterium]|nr:ribonuclease III [Lachnospiraceae bacterium]
MEKSISSFTGSLDETFGLPSRDWKQYSPLTLAYIGDAAYELVIRTIYVKRENIQPQKLHRKVTDCVKAKAQAAMMEALLPELNEEEKAIYRRGRNSKPYTKAKNATMREYLEATGFEALMGYLYLDGQFERMNELIAKGLNIEGKHI